MKKKLERELESCNINIELDLFESSEEEVNRRESLVLLEK